jgi:hypothetical protein
MALHTQRESWNISQDITSLFRSRPWPRRKDTPDDSQDQCPESISLSANSDFAAAFATSGVPISGPGHGALDGQTPYERLMAKSTASLSAKP